MHSNHTFWAPEPPAACGVALEAELPAGGAAAAAALAMLPVVAAAPSSPLVQEVGPGAGLYAMMTSFVLLNTAKIKGRSALPCRLS